MTTAKPMQLGMVGLGRMGANIVRRLMRDGHEIVAFDVNPDAVSELEGEGAEGASSLADMASKLSAPRSVWVMVPAGEITEKTVDDVAAVLESGDAIVDGGNSYYRDDIRRAADLKAARYIKVKLMKLGGLDRLAKAIDTIRECGMEPVLGNGVACEIGCWMEACVARGRIDNAGEMNGFLKPATRLLKAPLKFEDGAVVLEPGFQPALDYDMLAGCTVATRQFA